MSDTVAYYDTNAADFAEATLDVDMTPLYQRFLGLLSEGGHILDVGCGAGRDVSAFLERGYEVTAIDASKQMAALAEQQTGQPIKVMRVEEVNWHECFDGIWACASLLHVPRAGLPGVVDRLANALRPSGVLYCSFKYGQTEREHDGRWFTDLDEAGLETLLRETNSFELIESWRSGDRRQRKATHWLNALLRRVEM